MIKALFIALVFLGGCKTTQGNKNICELTILPRNHFDKPKVTIESQKRLLYAYSDLLVSIKNREVKKYLQYIHPKKGIIFEYKAHWTVDDVKNEIGKTDSYFDSVYFCDHCLSDTLMEVCVVELDFIWLSPTDVSIQSHFRNHPDWNDRILVTGWFEEKGKWFVNQGF
jgi:hypothetical protein